MKSNLTTPPKLALLELDSVRCRATWLDEPKVQFAEGRLHSDPKTGIPLYGPRSFGTARHMREVHVGFIGTCEAVQNAIQFLAKCSEGVAGDKDHAPFPGCNSEHGFRFELRTDDSSVELISRQEHAELLGIRNSRQRFERILSLLEEKMCLLCQRDNPPDYIFLVLPHDLYLKCRTAEYVERGLGRIQRNLRRSFKAMAMRFQKPTQMLRETTTGLASTQSVDRDHESVIAWNLFTGMYFKAGGIPWGPSDLPPASCHVGISFFRPLGEQNTLRTSVVQAFDENGEGLVLRGHRFDWDENRQGRSPHLNEEMAAELIEMVLEQYRRERKQMPQRIIIHKSSRYEPEERAGFEAALRGKVDRYDLLALNSSSDVRLVRAGKRPPLRGTTFMVGDVAYFYTTGYIPLLGRYPHGHVPSPLQVADHVGDTPMQQLLREIWLKALATERPSSVAPGVDSGVAAEFALFSLKWYDQQGGVALLDCGRRNVGSATASESSEKQCRMGDGLRRSLLLRRLRSSGTVLVESGFGAGVEVF